MFKADNKIKNYFNNVKRGFKHDLKNNFMSVAFKGFCAVNTAVTTSLAIMFLQSPNIELQAAGVVAVLAAAMFGGATLAGMHGMAKTGRDETLRTKMDGAMNDVEFKPHQSDILEQGVSIVSQRIREIFFTKPRR